MDTPRVDRADRMSQADYVITAVTEKLKTHRPLLSSCRHGSLTWRVDERGKVSVELKPTL
jgi:hypothetical protein